MVSSLHPLPHLVLASPFPSLELVVSLGQEKLNLIAPDGKRETLNMVLDGKGSLQS